MRYELIRDIHLYTITPCVPLGFYLIVFSTKGGAIHKRLGKFYAVLMVFSSMVSLWLPAHVGPQWLDHFGWIHSLSLVTVASIPYSLWQLQRGNIRSHKLSMLFLYWTGLLIAGAFTLVPGRYLHEVVFG